MKVQLAALADAANIAQPGNKLNLLGVFSQIWAPSFPTIHPFMVLVIRLEFDYDDGGKSHRVEVKLSDEDGREYLHGGGAIALPRIEPGEILYNDQILRFAGLQLRSPGQFKFAISSAGRELATAPLFVRKTPEGE